MIYKMISTSDGKNFGWMTIQTDFFWTPRKNSDEVTHRYPSAFFSGLLFRIPDNRFPETKEE